MLESKKGKIAEIKFLGSVIQENTSLRGRIAILTYQDLSYSSIADRIIIFIEHLQSVTVFLISNYRFFTNKNSTSIDIITMVYAALAAFHPASYMIPSKKATKQILVLTLIAFLIFWFKMIIFGYIVMVAVKQKSPSKNLQVAWQWIFKLQTRVTYYFMAAIWTSLIEASFRDLLDVGEEINILLRVLGILMFVLEFGFSFLLKSQFTCVLPNKSFASSKNNITPILTLLQKFVNQLIRRVLSFTPGTAIWVTSIIVTMLSTVKLSCYFYYLPYYKIECLFYEMYFIVVVSALNVACLLQVIFGDGIIDINLMIGLWIILSALGLKIAVNYLKERLFKVVFENKKLHPEALVHKALTAKYFLKNRQSIQKQDWNNLVKLTLKENIVKAFPNQTFGIAAADLEEKETRNNIFSGYLEELLVKFPKNDFLRLYAAYHFAKKQRLFSKCLRAINELKKTNSWKVDASMSVLFQEIKHKIISDSQSKENIFDISEFALSTSSFAQAKLQILKQMELQAGIYKEMKEPSPLLTKINKLGQEVIIMKRKIEASRKRLFQNIPEYYVEPMLLYAYYELVLNHSYERFAHYHGIYNRRFLKYAKVFHSDDFCQENSFNKNTAFFIFSGEKKTQGKILHCGGNYEEIFGRNVSGYYLGITVPTIALTEHRTLFSYIFENGDKMKLNKMKRRFYYHQDGYMIEIQYSFNISPYLSQGLAYYVVFQPVKSFRECILINKEGGIECFTKGVGEQLGLFALRNEERNIGRICSELEEVNEAFNIVNNVGMTKPRKNKGESYAISREDEKVPGKSLFAIKGPMMNLEEAKEICSSFHEEGNKIIHLEKITNDTNYGNNITFAYRCYINFLTNNKNGAKEIYLERVLENNPVSRNNIFGDAFNNDKNLTSSVVLKEEKIEWEECPETYENEKEAGWINFQTLEINCKMTSNPDIAPEMVSSARHLLTSSRSIKQPHQTQINTQFQSLLTGGTEEGQKNKKKNQDTFSQGLLSRQESVFSLQSDFSNRNKMKNQRIFEKANLTFYKFPKYQFLTLVLYVVLVTVFVLQQVLNYRVSEGFDELGSNKEIVLASESRNYYIVYLNTIICWIYGQATGLLEISTMIPGSNLATFQMYVGWGVANLIFFLQHVPDMGHTSL